MLVRISFFFKCLPDEVVKSIFYPFCCLIEINRVKLFFKKNFTLLNSDLKFIQHYSQLIIGCDFTLKFFDLALKFSFELINFGRKGFPLLFSLVGLDNESFGLVGSGVDSVH